MRTDSVLHSKSPLWTVVRKTMLNKKIYSCADTIMGTLVVKKTPSEQPTNIEMIFAELVYNNLKHFYAQITMR